MGQKVLTEICYNGYKTTSFSFLIKRVSLSHNIRMYCEEHENGALDYYIWKPYVRLEFREGDEIGDSYAHGRIMMIHLVYVEYQCQRKFYFS